MNWRRRERPEAEMGRPFLGALAVHGSVVVLALLMSLSEPQQIEFMTFQVDIVAAPPEQVRDTPVPAAEEIVVETPDPTPPQPEPQVTTPPPVVERVVPDPTPDPDPPKPDPKPPEPEVRNDPPARAAEPEDDAELTGEDITIRMQGIQRDFPAYYGNIQRQILRCFRPPPGAAGRETTIYFEIRPNGQSTSERFEVRSGSSSFDFAALQAIADCAGKNGAFGSLPEDFPYERLPILFTFRPGGEGFLGTPLAGVER